MYWSGDGPIAQVGGDIRGSVYFGDVNLYTGVPVRTRYRSIVERIAPPLLLDRESELTELAAFTTDPDSAKSYGWWRAGPWAGKTALMAWFALHPPQGVRVVSFFITARLSGQADRVAFVDNLLEQLLTIMGEPPPALLTPATKESHLAGLLDDAAWRCRARGERLVLLVDGLDEDRGVTVDPDSHSIAALLPLDPPAGLRVLVSGRPDPPIPGDVEDGHPLRDPSVVRVLDPSSRAQALRREMERDLQRLLNGSPLEKALLGLLTAAGGGLTADDLASLTDTHSWEVRHHLTTVSGRSFTQRVDTATTDSRSLVYLMGHEELHATAVEMIGPRRLAEYRDRVHAWAGRHRDGGWAVDTPGYLLQGYHTMLLTAGDLERATALCTDAQRHDRLLVTSGTDTAALDQIAGTTAQQMARVPPDLIALARLAAHRDQLTDRNAHIPATVATTCARLGDLGRALSLARSITYPGDQARALRGIAVALARAGNFDQALITARSVPDPDRRAGAVGDVAEAAASAGSPEIAVRWARSIEHPRLRVRALVRLAAVGSAPTLVDEAVALALSIDSIETRARSLGEAMMGLVRLGRLGEANVLVDDVLELMRSMPRRHVDAELCALALLLADADNIERASEAARSITEPEVRVQALSGIARVLARTGRRKKAEILLEEALADARAISDRDQRTGATGRVIVATAHIGAVDRAEALSSTVTDPYWRAQARRAVATTLAQRGQHIQAVRTAETIEDRYWRAEALGDVAAELAEAGHTGQASALVERALFTGRSTGNPEQRAGALCALATALGQPGHDGLIADLLTIALTTAKSIPDADRSARALCRVVTTFVRTANTPAALTAARVDYDDDRAEALSAIAVALAEVGDADQALSVAREIEPAHWTDREAVYRKDKASAAIAVALARAGRFADALSEARSIGDPIVETVAIGDVASLLADAGHFDQAWEIVRSISVHGASYRSISSLTNIAIALTTAGREGAALQLLDRSFAATDTVSPSPEQVRAVTEIALAYHQLGRDAEADAAFERAMVDAERSIRSRPAQVLGEVAVALARTGRLKQAHVAFTRATQSARAAWDPSDSAKDLIALADSVLPSGTVNLFSPRDVLGEILAVANGIPGLQARGRVLGRVAALVAADDETTATALTVSSLHAGRWIDALGALESLCPAAVVALATEIVALYREVTVTSPVIS